MVSKCVVIVLMIAAGIICVEKYFKAVVVPILNEWIAMRIDQDVVNNFDEEIDTAICPNDLVATLEILCGIFRPQPAFIDRAPFCLCPDGFIGDAVNCERRV